MRYVAGDGRVWHYHGDATADHCAFVEEWLHDTLEGLHKYHVRVEVKATRFDGAALHVRVSATRGQRVLEFSKFDRSADDKPAKLWFRDG